MQLESGPRNSLSNRGQAETAVPLLLLVVLTLFCAACEGPLNESLDQSASAVDKGGPQEDFRPLFDGESLAEWEGDPDWFRIEDGAIVAGSLLEKIPHNLFLTTTDEFRDFELRLEVKLVGDPETANAGIQVRSRRLPDHHEMVGYQADMGQHYWGCLYDESRRNRILAEPNREELAEVLDRDGWNDYRIRCAGRKIQLWINDFQTVDYREEDDEIEQAGLIGLQIHSGPPSEAYYRNIRIKELPPLAFKRHPINPDSAFEAASFVDVNGDDQTDIVCGGFWYEAPEWERHFLRDVPEQGGYYLDFANLPYDVNGDGRLDIITVAWHDQTVSWVENGPGEKFEVHSIDQPGNMETALLADLNGDGFNDLLPAVVNSPTWYEAGKRNSEIIFTAHSLPEEIKGHGLGAGDIDGDGDLDLVGPEGWLENTSATEWEWRAEFELGSTSVPILVHDVDSDGDADLIWGKGHDYGIYWLEQGPEESGRRTWKKHPIDESWSQAHYLQLADLDNDGDQDLVTGKRYKAHNGNDPGSDDPQVVYWYSYDSEWVRYPVEESGVVGFGISSDIEDFDSDGDLDILAPGKGGLYLMENLLQNEMR